LDTKFDEAQDMQKDTRHRATSTKRSLNTTCRKRGPKPGTQETPTDTPAEAAPTTWWAAHGAVRSECG